LPTYQYACTVCDHAFEQFQSFTEDSLTECPECSGRLRKVFNAVGVVFKGSGFYRTDSRAASSAGDSSHSHNGSHPEGHNGSKPEASKSESTKGDSSTKAGSSSSTSAKKTADSTSAA
jgi:putative FmdB family regulatory protein